MSVIDLSKLKPTSDPSQAEYDALSPEEKAQVDAMAAKHAAEVPGHKCRTAFLVVVEQDGSVVPVADLDLKLTRSWVPTPNDFLSAAAFLQATVQVQSTANATVTAIQRVSMAQAQAMQNQHLASQLNLKG